MKFNEALLLINAEVMKQHPEVGFYEAQGFLVATDSVDGPYVDGTIDVDKFKAVYTNMNNGTYIGTIKDGKVNIEFVNEPWLEDIIMTPYVPTDIEFAIKLITDKLGKHAVGAGPVTLRHQLFPGEAEPRYFFGTIANCKTVNVYTGKINEPLQR